MPLIAAILSGFILIALLGRKTLKNLSFEDISIKLHPEVYIKLKLNIARSIEEAKEQSKSGKAIISMEVSGGDIRSDRAQKDAKRFEKKSNLDKKDKIIEEKSPVIETTKNEIKEKEHSKEEKTKTNKKKD